MRALFTFTGRCAAAAALVALAGCAHPIIIATDKSAPAEPIEKKVQKNVGFVVPDNLLAKEVITPGGGGDKVSYLPYRDLELPLYSTLSNVFANATKLKSTDDRAAIEKAQLSYIVTPEITTDSSSDSAFTWPPTRFTVNMTCTVTDLSGNVVLKKVVTGQGNAEFAEFKKNFALSAQRASEDMLMKLQKMLDDAPELRAELPSQAATASAAR
ncbi:hypothetical protein EM868_11305 [Cupriavidus gilardii]|uniref:hypothetical protein n=1 Tax=Cupriavidus gilardii TaxID=82541 RepID=UPI001EE571F6|nr:hypothetical protein [Cupriavidus gilardii]MCG5262249.1 hypothetical protein [Cupriavidus gilardii]MDF9430379.1 hypothetical protein [Cupriavidus gilardii]